jgi:hypothetical protein
MSTRHRSAATRLLVVAFVLGIAFLQISLCVAGTAVTSCCDHQSAVQQASPTPQTPFVADDVPIEPGTVLELCLIVSVVLLIVLAGVRNVAPVGLRAPPVRVVSARSLTSLALHLTQLCVSRT